MLRRYLCLALLAALPLSAQAGELIDNRKEYVNCLELAKQDASTAYEHAVGWEGLGGGDAARHCQALALMYLGKHEEAANRLEKLADTAKLPVHAKAEMLGQAAQARILMDDLDHANADQTTAIKLDPKNTDLYIDRSVTLFGAGDYKGAEADLDQAIKLSPKRAEAYALRAATKRFQDKVDAAMTDADMAVKLTNAQYPEALLERGILRRLKDNKAGAREDWMTLLRLNPDGETADEARRNLELMDVKGTQK